MQSFEWDLMKDFLQNGNMGSFMLYRELTMSEKEFNAKYPEAEETEEFVQ